MVCFPLTHYYLKVESDKDKLISCIQKAQENEMALIEELEKEVYRKKFLPFFCKKYLKSIDESFNYNKDRTCEIEFDSQPISNTEIKDKSCKIEYDFLLQKGYQEGLTKYDRKGEEIEKEYDHFIETDIDCLVELDFGKLELEGMSEDDLETSNEDDDMIDTGDLEDFESSAVLKKSWQNKEFKPFL